MLEGDGDVAAGVRDVAERLRRHGVEARVETTRAHGRRVLEVLLDGVSAEPPDLLVLGAYGRSRASEWLFGGVTSEVLDAARAPVLLSH